MGHPIRLEFNIEILLVLAFKPLHNQSKVAIEDDNSNNKKK